ncbi:Eco57I restriction-modification methylase domain-containing protein [Halorussus salinisoli]|uniref:Eco57I restriction-modification methylase domain-containing protein n=1 Tax=Halorussus salinisoli TaxID=2558242 RepID=UPI0010C1C005|nr:TaqI-like C-terminal specificity domain-containing protein [Halorussus salinisoli]
MSSSFDPSENPLHSVATEFVTEEFDTQVPDDAIDDLATTIEDIVRDLRNHIGDDDLLQALLHSHPGGKVLEEKHSIEKSDPENLTVDDIIDTLFGALDYPYRAPEPGDLSDEYGNKADFGVSLREYDDIESKRLLIEAEPLNKKLDQNRHGIGQIKDWLGQRKFEADFGIATDGMRWALIKYDRDSYSYDQLTEPYVDLQPAFIAAFENVTGRGTSLTEWVDDAVRQALADFIRVFQFQNFLSIAGEANTVIRRKQSEISDDFYEAYIERVFGILDEDTDGRDTERCLVGNGVVAPSVIPEEDRDEQRRLFSVSLMNRLIFIKFLEDSGVVDEELLSKLKERHETGGHPQSFYQTFIKPLIYDVFNQKPEHRPDHAQDDDLYDVPYLNGGLFRTNLDHEREYDVRDSVLLSIIEFLENYTFSAAGNPDDLDPSILGTVFEKTINYLAGEEGAQKELGAYYTPDDITRFCADKTVQSVLFERFKEAIQKERGWPEAEFDNYDGIYDLIDALEGSNDLIDTALEEVDEFRVVDPACGSGHFLTSVLGEIVEIRQALYAVHSESKHLYELKKQTVLENLYGVDIVGPGVEITKLRLWLSIISELTTEEIDDLDQSELALPNVAFNIRQGNSLIGYTDTNRLRDDGVESHHLGDYATDSIENLIEERQDKVDEYKQVYGMDAQRLEGEIAEKDEEYNSRLNNKLLQDFKDADIAFDYDVDEIGQPDLEPESIHKVTLRFTEPLADDEKDHLDEKFRDEKGMRINNGTGGYVSMSLSHKYLLRTPESRVQRIIDNIGEDRIDDMEVERYLTETDLAGQDYLHWPLEFYEVFDEQGGFDVVVSNPPYGIDLSDAEAELADYPDTNHSSVVFETRSEELVREHGKIAFVVPKSLTYAHRWMSAREHLLDTDLEYLIDVGKAFEGVDAEQIILTLMHGKATDPVTVGRREEDGFFEKAYQQSSLSRECFYMWVDEDNESLIKTLQEYPSFGEIDYADATKGIDYFKDYVTEDGDGLHAYRGDDISQFRFVHESRFDESILERNDVKPDDHEQKKVVWQDILAHVTTPVPRIVLQAAVDYEGAYIADTAIFATSEEHSCEYLCGLLNSSLFSWYAYTMIHNRAIRTMHFTPIYFSRLPAPPEDDEELIQRIEKLTEAIQDLDPVQEDAIMARYEKLNQAVNDLYQLDMDERQLLEEEAPPHRPTLAAASEP